MLPARWLWPAALAALTTVAAAQTLPRDLLALAETEHAFAKMASDTTPRDAFIEYFADASVSFAPEPGPARARLANNPRAFPEGMQLKWEPRLGDIAASGDLGFLTGPSESILPGQPPRFGSYFSLWKRQADGTYRVILDVGVGLPAPAIFADGFVRSDAIATYAGAETQAAAEAALLRDDRMFGRALAVGVADAYAQTLHPSGRLHRSGWPLMADRAVAITWLNANVKAMTCEPLKAEAGASGDLGYTWGAFTLTSAAGEASKGYYVRAWTRAADGRWQLAVDVTEPSRR